MKPNTIQLHGLPKTYVGSKTILSSEASLQPLLLDPYLNGPQDHFHDVGCIPEGFFAQHALTVVDKFVTVNEKKTQALVKYIFIVVNVFVCGRCSLLSSQKLDRYYWEYGRNVQSHSGKVPEPFNPSIVRCEWSVIARETTEPPDRRAYNRTTMTQPCQSRTMSRANGRDPSVFLPVGDRSAGVC
jgi:hypothetical protein